MSHNRQLDALLTQVKETAEKAREEKGFAPAFSLLRAFRQTVGPIKYDNSAKWYAVTAIAAIGGAFAAAYFASPRLQQSLGDAGYAVMGAFGLALVIMLIVIGTAGGAIDEISELIFEKDVYYDNGLTALDIEGKKKELYHEFKKAFGDFRNRGDEDRYVKRMVRGSWTGTEHSFPYDYYVFHYVRVYYVMVAKKVGKATVMVRERRTETLYRRGLIIDFPYVKGVAIRGGGGSYDYPEEFEPTSEEFNANFSAGADTAQTAAKFLKPAVVLAFVELAKHFSGLNVEINRQGRMNIAFSDGDVLDLERKFSIAQPDEFEREIRSHLGLPKLRLLLQFVETLKKHSDSNF